MKIRGEKTELMKIMGSVQNIAGTKTVLPILSNVLIEATKDKLKLTATDLEVGVINSAKFEVLEEGTTTVPAKKIFEIIRELPDGQVVLAAKKNNTVTIECKKSFFKIPGLPKEEFPKLPEFHNKEMFSLSQKDLREMLAKTIFAISRDDTRHVLNGALFLIQPNKITVVATDGRRLALAEKQARDTGPVRKKAIVPAKAIQELMRALKDGGDAAITLGENHILFKVDDLTIISRLIEGEFPNYEQVIPPPQKDKLSIDREDLLQATKRVSLLTTAESQAVKFDLLKDKVVISKNSPELGEAMEELSAEYKGQELSVGFNPHYIIDALKNLQTDRVNIEFTDPDKRGIIRDSGDYLYLVLPMQLG
ncbi:MAG: DNA polymerase III subunit beta [Candidatus Omnitrophota bacterium]